MLSLGEVEAEMQRRGGFVPVMHLFPRQAQHPGLSIPWTAADQQLEHWMAGSQVYKAAAAQV